MSLTLMRCIIASTPFLYSWVLGTKNPARTKRSSGVSIGGESYEQDHFWPIAEQGSYVATLFASLVEMYEFAT